MNNKTKAYVSFGIATLCILLSGLGYMVSYIDDAYVEWFNISNRMLIIAILIFLPVIAYFLIKKGLHWLR
jgi:hypothetical protein